MKVGKRSSVGLAFCLFIAACGAPRPANIVATMNPGGIAGMYRAAGGTAALELRADSSARLTAGSAAPREGRWSSLPPQIRFDFEPAAGTSRPDSITWTIRGDDLVPLIWDKSAFEANELLLRRVK